MGSALQSIVKMTNRGADTLFRFPWPELRYHELSFAAALSLQARSPLFRLPAPQIPVPRAFEMPASSEYCMERGYAAQSS